jgi:nicotinamide-nucleotide amidase
LSRPRAVIVVTGSELVRGERTDLNGPFLAREALRLGLEPARIAIVGDVAEELEAVLRAAFDEGDAVLTSGGLGPTHDDRTVELVAKALGVGLRVDPDLAAQIEGVSRAAAQRLKRDYADFAPGVTKQATVPVGARTLGLAGTAPGLLIPREGGRVVVVLPGPPSELQRLWPNALESDEFRTLLARTQPPGRRVMRLFGVSESAVARALAEAGGDGDGVEVTICARDFEIHVDFVVQPGAEGRADALEAAFSPPLEQWLYGRDERGVEEHVLELWQGTGPLPGSSDVVLVGVVAYADEVKRAELGVPAELIAAHGAVSAEVAAAMAQGARERLGADVAVSVTGIAGPGGGTAEKPVGLVYLHAEGPDGGLGREFSFPGDRGSIRARSVVGALHLVRRLLTQSPDDSV